MVAGTLIKAVPDLVMITITLVVVVVALAFAVCLFQTDHAGNWFTYRGQ